MSKFNHVGVLNFDFFFDKKVPYFLENWDPTKIRCFSYFRNKN